MRGEEGRRRGKKGRGGEEKEGRDREGRGEKIILLLVSALPVTNV